MVVGWDGGTQRSRAGQRESPPRQEHKKNGCGGGLAMLHPGSDPRLTNICGDHRLGASDICAVGGTSVWQ